MVEKARPAPEGKGIGPAPNEQHHVLSFTLTGSALVDSKSSRRADASSDPAQKLQAMNML
jgi:hypothetical protein